MEEYKVRLLYYTFIFILLVPSTAFAYLDPGTGNILVYIVISLIGAVAFSLKGAFYKLIGKKGITSSGKSKESTNDIVIFSEGKNYWNTFKPVVDALIKEGHNFSYSEYTAYLQDKFAPRKTERRFNDLLNKHIKFNNLILPL